MPYVQFELDAFDGAHLAAGILGAPPQQITGGLVLLWAWCWRSKTECVTQGQLAGLFQISDPRLADALLEGGFLERVDAGLRVRGAQRYLRLSSARAAAGRKGGSKRQANAKQTSNKQEANGKLRQALSSSIDHREDQKQLPPSVGVSAGAEMRAAAGRETLEPGEPSGERSPPRAPPVDELAALWNSTADPALPRWASSGQKRHRAALARLREHPDLAYWREVIARISASAFCRGLTERGSWRASPDWLVQPDTAGRVLEGKYDDARPPLDVRRGPQRAEDQGWPEIPPQEAKP